MYKKFTVAALVVSLSLCSCATTVPVHEAREYGMDRIDKITLSSGQTYHLVLDSIDDGTNRVIGRRKGHVFEYKKEEIKFFQSTKDGLTALLVAAVVGVGVIAYELANLDLNFSSWR